jgi:hypothetical protein
LASLVLGNFCPKSANNSLSLSIACQSPGTWAAADSRALNFILTSDLTVKIQSMTAALFAIFVPAVRQRSDSHSACFGKSVTCCSQEKHVLPPPPRNGCFYTDTSHRMEGGMRQVLRGWAPPRRQIIDILSERLVTFCRCVEPRLTVCGVKGRWTAGAGLYSSRDSLRRYNCRNVTYKSGNKWTA